MFKKIILALCLVFISSVSFAAPQRTIPVLMYHSVANIKNNPAVVSPENFKNQMAYLEKNGYHPISLEELYKYLTTNNYSLPTKPTVITFDDGYRDTFSTAMPILKKFNFSWTLFLITKKIGTVFSAKELEIMKKSGAAIYPHTDTHPDLRNLSFAAQEKEIKISGDKIKKLTGKYPEFFCYPYSHYNSLTLKLMKKYGYKMAFTNHPGWVKKGENLLTLKRIYIGNNVSLSDFAERVNNPNYRIIK